MALKDQAAGELCDPEPPREGRRGFLGKAALRLAGVRSAARHVATELPLLVAAHVIAEEGVSLVHHALEGLPSPSVRALHERADLIASIFFNSCRPTDVVPANGHPGVQATVKVGAGVHTYSCDYHVLNEIRLFHDESQIFEVQAEQWTPRLDYSLICTGGSNSNALVARLLGTAVVLDERSPRPTFAALGPRDSAITLPYTIAYLPRSQGEVWSYQEGRRHAGAQSVIIANELGLRHAALPEFAPDGKLQNDYLLVTRVPGQYPDTVNTFFSGLHGTGTRSVGMLLRTIPTEDLHDLQQLLRNADTQFFQAVFQARALRDINSVTIAEEIRLVRHNAPPVPLKI